MIKQILYITFIILACSLSAQTTATDTIKPTPTQTIPVTAPTETLQTTPTTTTVSTTATQTLQPAVTPTVQATVPNIKHRRKPGETFEKENKEISALYHEAYDKKKEIVLQNKRFCIYNNYLTAGAGKCYNTGWKDWELSTAFDYNFHVKRNYFQFGAMLAGPGIRDNNVIQLHMGWGYRLERCNYFWAAYGGLSYSDGYKLQQGYLQQPDTIYKVKLSTIGVYANLQFYYKLKFDYGLGLSAFIDANAKQTLSGIRLELFFSGAYRGLKKINYAKEEEKEKY